MDIYAESEFVENNAGTTIAQFHLVKKEIEDLKIDIKIIQDKMIEKQIGNNEEWKLSSIPMKILFVISSFVSVFFVIYLLIIVL